MQVQYPEDKKFAVCLTHDVDDIYQPLNHLFVSCIYNLKKLDFGSIGNDLLLRTKGKEFNPYRNFKEIMELGASGVQMGTRFVTTDECDASMTFKQTYIDSGKNDMAIINSPVGMPGRAINNEFIEKINRGEKRPVKCPHKCLKTCNIESTPYCIVAALVNAMKGNFYNGFAFAGSNAFIATKITSVKETVDSLIREFKEALPLAK